MSGLIGGLIRLHDNVFSALESATKGWFIGLFARFTFASVLMFYYLNSGWNKLGEGIFGFLNPSFGAYASILPPVIEAYGYDQAAIPLFPWYFIVVLGTVTEIILPILIILGLFSRIAALGMIGFVIVQSYVDIAYHGLTGDFVGSMFDRLQDAIIWDQRFLWCFVLIIIVVNGPGKISLDYLLSRRIKAN